MDNESNIRIGRWLAVALLPLLILSGWISLTLLALCAGVWLRGWTGRIVVAGLALGASSALVLLHVEVSLASRQLAFTGSLVGLLVAAAFVWIMVRRFPELSDPQHRGSAWVGPATAIFIAAVAAYCLLSESAYMTAVLRNWQTGESTTTISGGVAILIMATWLALLLRWVLLPAVQVTQVGAPLQRSSLVLGLVIVVLVLTASKTPAAQDLVLADSASATVKMSSFVHPERNEDSRSGIPSSIDPNRAPTFVVTAKPAGANRTVLSIRTVQKERFPQGWSGRVMAVVSWSSPNLNEEGDGSPFDDEVRPTSGPGWYQVGIIDISRNGGIRSYPFDMFEGDTLDTPPKIQLGLDQLLLENWKICIESTNDTTRKKQSVSPKLKKVIQELAKIKSDTPGRSKDRDSVTTSQRGCAPLK